MPKCLPPPVCAAALCEAAIRLRRGATPQRQVLRVSCRHSSCVRRLSRGRNPWMRHSRPCLAPIPRVGLGNSGASTCLKHSYPRYWNSKRRMRPSLTPRTLKRNSTWFCVTMSDARRRSTSQSDSRSTSRMKTEERDRTSTSRGRTSTTPVRTRSTTPWDRCCSRNAWENNASSQRRERDSTASPPPPSARDSDSSASSTWVPRTWKGRSSTSSA
mmetsp:Transcript_9160/g.24605  ORF Transcript_9160/g.24605 Transcript_9160/m.24605 type:complete len:215 (-) Transcript_9160:1949-2593(-)